MSAPRNGDQHLVRIERFRDKYTLTGPPVIIRPLDEIADALASSSFMRGWIVEAIKKGLLAGEEFTYRADYDRTNTGQVRSIYRLASHAEIIEMAEAGTLEQAKAPAAERRRYKEASQATFTLAKRTKALEALLAEMPKQARTIIGILVASGKTEFTEQSLEVVLNAKAEEVKTKQGVMKVFNFYKKQYISQGHLTVEEPAEEPEEEEAEDGDDE